MSQNKLPKLSGHELLKFFCNRLGCTPTRQAGSHVNVKGIINGKAVVFTIPLHNELDPGTLLAVLRSAGLSREEFLQIAGKKK